jgi:type II secretory pathway component PulF
MIYPVVIMSVAVIAIAVLLIFVIPVFESMFAGVGMALPLPTRVVIGASGFLRGYWWAVIAGATGGTFLFKRYYATSSGKLTIEAKGQLVIKGQSVSIKSDSTMDIKATGTLSVNGSLVNINS